MYVSQGAQLQSSFDLHAKRGVCSLSCLGFFGLIPITTPTTTAAARKITIVLTFGNGKTQQQWLFHLEIESANNNA